MSADKKATLAKVQKYYRKELALHYEYMAIQNQRVAMVNLMHLWHQIGFPAAVLVYATFVRTACEQQQKMLVWIAFGLATVLLIMVRIYTRRIDAKAIKLYPRIITLEIMLGFRFYRDYLNRNSHVTPGSLAFVKEAEALAAKGELSPNEYSRQVDGAFCPEAFPASRRGHRELDIMAFVLILLLAMVSFLIYSNV